MCGINGFIGSKVESGDIILDKMGSKLSHRGPDQTGYFNHFTEDLSVQFGHKRLSIIDLNERSNQPMISSDGKAVIIFNGEIYNYKELRSKTPSYNYKTESDTEVILALYLELGIKETLFQLNGIFSFVIFDILNKETYLVRDRIGVKPLYYTTTKDNIIFSSEISPLLEFPTVEKEIDVNALELFLALRYIPGEKSIYKNIQKVLPGNFIKVSPDLEIKKNRYFFIDDEVNNNITESDIEIELHNSIIRNLIADVEVVSLLSSGVDSSLVTLISSLHTNKLKSYTVGLHDERDESKAAKIFAEELRIRNTTHKVTNEELIDTLLDIGQFIDEPHGDPSFILTYLISARIKKDGIKVMLSGDGGDEFFYGYNSYQEITKSYKKFWILNKLYRVNRLLNLFKSSTFIGYILNLMKDKISFIYGFNSGYAGWFAKSSLLEHHSDNFIEFPKVTAEILEFKEQSILNLQNKFDKNYYLPDNILVKLDRSSMKNSIESRVPLLDYTLTNLACKISSDKHMAKGKKIILKNLLLQLKPNYSVEAKKGFSIDINSLLNAERVKSKLIQYTQPDFISKQGIFNLKKIRKIILNHHRNKKSDSFVWNFLVFQLWYETNFQV